MTRKEKTIGFIGGGKMAEAIIKGIIASGFISPENIFCFDIDTKRTKYLLDTYRINTCHNNHEVCLFSSLLILAVKPQQINDVLFELKNCLEPDQLVVSIAAGISLDHIRSYLGTGVRAVRVMPNTPCLVGEGMTAIAPDANCSKQDISLVEAIFSSVGAIYKTEEDKINIITAISGSGPAFFYDIAESFARAGKRQELPYEDALLLITQTMRGAARMLAESGKSTKELIDMVSSPGGTTVAGLRILQDGIVREKIELTVAAAKLRADELSRR